MPTRLSHRRISPTQAVAALDDAHREVTLHLQELKALVESLRASAMAAEIQARVSSVLAFFNGPSRDHNAHEERYIFPSLLAGSDSSVLSVIERLREEHAWIELQWLDIEAQLVQLLQGQLPHDLASMDATVDVFVSLMLAHMALESSAIHPQLRLRMATF